MEDIIGDIESVGSSFQSMILNLLDPFIEYNKKKQGKPKPQFPGVFTEADGFVQGGEAPSSTEGNDEKTDKDSKYPETVQEFVKNYIEKNNLKNKGLQSVKSHGTFWSDAQHHYGVNDADLTKYVKDVIGDLASGVLSG